MGTPGSVARREGFHPVLAFVLVVAGVVAMWMGYGVAQVAMQKGVPLGLRTLLVGSQALLVMPALRRTVAAAARDGLGLVLWMS